MAKFKLLFNFAKQSRARTSYIRVSQRLGVIESPAGNLDRLPLADVVASSISMADFYGGLPCLSYYLRKLPTDLAFEIALSGLP